MTLSKRKALSMATLLLPQLYSAGAVSAQPATAGGRPPDQPAAAEAAQPAAEAAEPTAPGRGKRAGEEEVVVTGSRVRRKDLTTPAPITVIDKEQVQASGKVSIADLLQTLPEQGNAINTSVNFGGDGSTRVSLRGLGAVRTLVLLNSRRFVPGGSGANGAADLSSIPAGALERIEVLKDGASALYGSDAIGGVLNIITRKRMNGVEATGFAGTSTHGDGSTYDLNILAGTSGERGNILFSGGYYDQQTVWAGDRDFAKIPRAFSTTGIGVIGGKPGEYTQGSGTVPQGTVVIPASQKGIPRPLTGNPDLDRRISFYNTMVTTFPTSNNFIWRAANDPRPKVCDPSNPNVCWGTFTTAQLYNPADPGSGGDGYNFQPANYLVTPQRRISLFSVGDTRLGSAARAYFEGSYVNRQSGQTLAPVPVLLGQEGVTVSANSIYNPFGIALGDVRRRMLEFGTRDFRQDIDTFRVVAGVDGALPEETVLKGWYWDVSFNYGRTVASNTRRGNLYDPALADALGPSMLVNGVPTCVRTAGNAATAIPGCVPLNMFGGPGGVTPDQLTPNIAYTGNQRGFNQLVSAQFNTSGELFKLLSERPVGLALGYEYRILSGQLIPDPIAVAGLTTGSQGSITAGHYYVNEGYGELSIPLVSGMPYVENLEATAALRVFNYSNFGSDYTYKFGGRWSLVRDFTVRGTYSTGFRAPDVSDLFLGQSDSAPSGSDPCRGPVAGGGPVPANCLAQGIPSTGTGDTQTQLHARVGGNPNLQPERAKIYTAGVVVEPRWVRGLSATVDYYNIRIDQSISPIGAQLILNQCYPTDPAAAPRYCDLVRRDPALGDRIVAITDIKQNVGGDATDGIDLAINYLLPTEVGRFNFIFDGTWLHKFDRTLADGSVIHGKNTYDIAQNWGGVYPAFKFISGIRYAYEGLSAGINTRFLSSFHECGSPTGNFNGTATCYDRNQPGDVGVDSTTSRTVSAYNTWDVFAGYTFPSFAGRTTIGAGVNNVFNANPAVIYNGATLAASDPTAYDFMGRFFYGRISHAF